MKKSDKDFEVFLELIRDFAEKHSVGNLRLYTFAESLCEGLHNAIAHEYPETEFHPAERNDDGSFKIH